MKLIDYSLEEILKARKGRSENCLISDWRSKTIMPSPEENSVARGNWHTDEREPSMRMLGINSSIEPIKVKTPLNDQPIDRDFESWSNVLHYHWWIAIHGLLLIMIFYTVGPWIGLRCNDEVSLSNGYDRFSLWRPFVALSSYSALKSSHKFSRGACSYRLYCANKNTDGEPVRRKASFLRRKRNLNDFID